MNINEYLSDRFNKMSEEFKGTGKWYAYNSASRVVKNLEPLTENDVLNWNRKVKFIGTSMIEHMRRFMMDARKEGIMFDGVKLNPHKHPTKRSEVTKKVYDIPHYLATAGIEFDIVGSYRRGCEYVGDVDILLWAPFPSLEPFESNIVSRGERRVKMVLDDFEVDLWSFLPKNRGCALLAFTGPANFNVIIRSRARRLGYKLNEYCLTSLPDGQEFYFETEEEVFKKLNMNYESPEERQKYRR